MSTSPKRVAKPRVPGRAAADPALNNNPPEDAAQAAQQDAAAAGGFDFGDWFQFNQKNVLRWQAIYYAFCGVMIMFAMDKFKEMHGVDKQFEGQADAHDKLTNQWSGCWLLNIAFGLYMVSETRTPSQIKAVCWSNFMIAAFMIPQFMFGREAIDFFGMPEHGWTFHGAMTCLFTAMICLTNDENAEDPDKQEVGQGFQIQTVIGYVNFICWVFFAGAQFGLYCDGEADDATTFIWNWRFPFLGLCCLCFTNILRTIATNPTKEQCKLSKICCLMWVLSFVNILFINKDISENAHLKRNMGFMWTGVCAFMAYLYDQQEKSM